MDDDVPADVAAVLGCAVLTGGGALLNAAPPEPGQSVMVVGLGGVGMAALLTAVAIADAIILLMLLVTAGAAFRGYRNVIEEAEAELANPAATP